MGATTLNDRQIDSVGALSVFGRSANTAGVGADIAAVASSGAVLRESSSVIGFGTIASAGIANSAVTYAKIQNVSATARVLGRKTAGAGVVEEFAASDLGTTMGCVILNSAAQTGTINITSTLTASSLIGKAGADFNHTATPFAQITTARAGVNVTVSASDAIAGSASAGAAAGGAIALTAGNAARLSSGNAAGGSITLTPGTGIGTGAAGSVIVAGTMSVTAGDLDVTRTAAVNTVKATISNTESTLGNSHALLVISTAQAATSNPYINFHAGASDYSIGMDSGDLNNFVISTAATLGTNALSISGAGVSVFTRTVTGTLASAQASGHFYLSGGTQNAGSGPSMLFAGDNSASAKKFMGRVSASWDNSTSGAEAASMVFNVRANSADTNAQTVGLKIGSDLAITGGIVNGGSWAIQTFTESLTLTASPTSTTANLLPANGLILDVSVRVTTTVTGTAATFDVGDATTLARFATAVAKASGSTAIGMTHLNPASTDAAGWRQLAAAKVRIGAVGGLGTLTGGVVEIVVHALVFVAPTS